jgi:DNA-binding phage protein
MDSRERMFQVQREQGKALVRSMHLAEIQAAGAARAAALHEAEAQLDRIAKALPAAIDAGISMAELARGAGVSRQTLYELRGRYGSSADLELAVLQVLATKGPLTVDGVAEAVGRSAREVQRITDGLLGGGDAEWVEAYSDELGDHPALHLTADGRWTLEGWWHVEEEREEAEAS